MKNHDVSFVLLLWLTCLAFPGEAEHSTVVPVGEHIRQAEVAPVVLREQTQQLLRPDEQRRQRVRFILFGHHLHGKQSYLTHLTDKNQSLLQNFAEVAFKIFFYYYYFTFTSSWSVSLIPTCIWFKTACENKNTVDIWQLCQLCTQESYTKGFHFEVDQLDSIKVNLVVDIVHSPQVGRYLRKKNSHLINYESSTCISELLN